MNPSMYLLAVLAFCALPSALGLMCYKCTANETALELCTNMSTYTVVTCTGANATCAKTEIVGVVKAYVLDCVNAPANCSSYNTSVCANAIQGAAARNASVSSCMTTCCKDKDKCNMGPTVPPTTAASTPTATSTNATMAPANAATDVFRPYLLALLFIALAVVGTQ